MTAISDLLETARAAVQFGRQAIDGLGFREFTVTLRLETYDRPVVNGAVLLSVAATVITPKPLVTLLGGEEASWFGAGTQFSDATGKCVVTVYRLEGITPEYSVGGYTLLQWMAKPASPKERFVILLVGPGIASLVDGGEPFQLAQAPKRESTLENSVVVKRVPVVHDAV